MSDLDVLLKANTSGFPGGSVQSTCNAKVKVSQSCPTLCNPTDYTYTVHGIFQARILEWVAFPFSRGSSQPRDQTQVSCIEVDSSPAEPQGKPKNTAVGSLPLLQGIFPPQVQFLGQEDALEKKIVTHSSILAWRIPRTEEPVHGVTKNRTQLGN